MDDLARPLVESARERWARRVCGVLTLGGGASGLILSLVEAPRASSILAFAIGMFFTLIYLGGVFIGVRHIEKQPGSWAAVIIYLWLQVPVVQTETITYFFGSLLSLTLTYAGGASFHSVYAPGSGWVFALFTAQPAFGIGFNVVPAVVLGALRLLNIGR